MCGIVAFIGHGNKNDLYTMTRCLEHRGPDAEGYYINPDHSLFFGHRRLSIRDVNLGVQPMKTQDNNLVVIFNGEIYNAHELRLDLESKGHRFFSGHSDTEVLLHGYKEWNNKLPDKLNGMWAFAIFDNVTKKVFISRDRFGKKPLYYVQQNNIFAFASEIKALNLHGQLSLSHSARGLKKYFAHGYFPYDTTLYQHVYKLPAGCNLTYNLNDSSFKVERYWNYTIEPDESKNEQFWVSSLRELLEKAVERRLVSDVPLGVFLSGGLDSSAISAIAKKVMPQKELLSFSIGFEDPSFDETEEAIRVSKYLNTKHSYQIFKTSLLQSLQTEMFSYLDEPLSDSSMMSYFLLCKNARTKITVALGGDGGDELFAGYDTYKALKIARILKRVLPSCVHPGILALISKLPLSHGYMPFQFKLQRLLQGIKHKQCLWNPLWLSPLSIEDVADIFHEPITLEELYSEAIEIWEKCQNKNIIDKTMEFYGKLFLTDQILVKVDRMSMMHSLEIRCPLLDVDLVECARQIPHYYKLKGYNKAKYILKRAVEPYLPKDVVWRKKIGFSAPLSKWLMDGSILYTIGDFWTPKMKNKITTKLLEHKNLERDNRLFLWNTYIYNELAKSSNVSM
jgi:asparagine synthase (glutamine-hydrolysing)